MGAQRRNASPARALRAPLVIVASSSVATSADGGAIALVLQTKESGPIAFRVTIESCAVLRCQIAIAEAALRKQSKKHCQTDANRICGKARHNEPSHQ
jgi:hypothetical protein